MRYIIILPLLIHLSIAMSQEDKPSWSEDLPERVDAPDLTIDPDVDTEIELDIDLNEDKRPNVFDDSNENLDDEQEAVRPNYDFDEQVDNKDEIEAQNQTAIEEAAAEKLAQEKAAAEQAAIEKAAAELVARENAAAENAAAEKAAREKAAAEKAAREKAAAELAAQETATTTENIINPELVQSNDEIIIYQWKKLANAAPNYPSRAARSGEEGWVEVEIELGVNGDVENAKVVNSYRNSKTFNREAIIAVKKWKYEPPINFGIEENQFKVVKIVFKL